jgi:methyltransferase (TIGR00027 family)
MFERVTRVAMDATSSASKTALMVCAYRARASQWPQPLFVDPWADVLAGSDGHLIAKRLDQRFPPMETWLALRVAYLDKLVHTAVDRWSMRQIVILGAGYDTRSARLPRAGVRYFEVDHPATQAEKQRRLSTIAGYPKQHATYVSCDFECEDPVTQLVAAGLSVDEPALVIWEGVVPYLTQAAVSATATRLAHGLDKRSVVAFDFVTAKLVNMTAKMRPQDRATSDFVGELGEPVRFGSDDILPLLADCGFRWVRVLDFNELALQMLGDYKPERMFRFQNIAVASVSATETL